jgi:hypothetical protein
MLDEITDAKVMDLKKSFTLLIQSLLVIACKDTRNILNIMLPIQPLILLLVKQFKLAFLFSIVMN